MKVKLNLSNFNNDFQSDSEISNLNSISDSLIPIGKSGIHIKKKNRGKFTEYCGGKVTDACIRKAKASGNPKLVKRATFAANARKWKHQQGGTIADLKTQLGETPWIRHKTFEEYDSLGRPIYNRYDSFYGDGIEQMQEGGPVISDVDTRSDTTRRGYHEGLPAYGAADARNTAGLWDLMNYRVVGDNVITGEPTLLPGRINNVLAMEKEAPTIFKMLSENPKGMRDLLQEVKVGIGDYFSKVYKPFNGLARKIKTYLETGDKNLLKEIEDWAVQNKNILVRPKETNVTPKGFTKGNEVTPDTRYPVSEEGLTVRTAKPIKLENPITTPEEAQAAKDWLAEQGYEYKPVKLVKRTKPTEAVKSEPKAVKLDESKAKITQKERYQDNKGVSKERRTRANYEDYYQHSDGRAVYAGNRRLPRLQKEESMGMMDKDPRYSGRLNRIRVRLEKYDKGTSAYKQAYKDLKNLIDDFDRNVRKIK